MKRKTMSRKHANALHAQIRRRGNTISAMRREHVALLKVQRASSQREQVLTKELEAERAKLDEMGRQLGRANMREASATHVAHVALNGICAVAHTVSVIAPPQIASTLFSLERDGRHQLLKLALPPVQSDAPGAHA